jgi:surface protein
MSPIYINNKKIKSIYTNNQSISKVYVGDELVFQKNNYNSDPFNELTIDTRLAGSASNTFILPLLSIDHVTVDWGDGAVEHFLIAGSKTHVYDTPGIYTVKMYGTGSQMFRFSNAGDRYKVISGVIGNTGWTSLAYTFYGCSSMTALDVSGLDVSAITNFEGAFHSCSSLISLDASAWVMSSNLLPASYVATFGMCGALDLKIGAGWNFSALTGGYNASTFLSGTDIGSTNYDNMLSIIASQTLKNNVTFGGGLSKYTVAGKVHRDAIIASNNWTFNDGGLAT